jgi:hydrogenase maturation protease
VPVPTGVDGLRPAAVEIGSSVERRLPTCFFCADSGPDPDCRMGPQSGKVMVPGTPFQIVGARSVLILGVGNVLMGDEGIGVHAARLLAQRAWPEGVSVLDGGTGGFHLLSAFQDHDVLVMIDATMDGRAPGTVTVLRPRFASDFPRTLSAHDIGLRDLVESAALLSFSPQIHLVTVSISSIQHMCMELSSEAAAALPRVSDAVEAIVKELRPGE